MKTRTAVEAAYIQQHMRRAFEERRRRLQSIFTVGLYSPWVAQCLLGDNYRPSNRSPKMIARLRHSMTRTIMGHNL